MFEKDRKKERWEKNETRETRFDAILRRKEK